MYERQDKLELNIPETVDVIGCGGAGSWAVIYSALIGVKNINIYDSDIIEEHNLNRLPFTIDSVGKLKTLVLKEMIKSMRPDCEVTVFKNITKTQFAQLLTSNCVMDCTDKFTIQKELYDYCKLYKVKYIKGGYDGAHMTVTQTIPMWAVKDEDESSYTTEPTPSFVLPAAMVANMMLCSAIYDLKPNVSKNIDEVILC